jgi:hypothetical protein
MLMTYSHIGVLGRTGGEFMEYVYTQPILFSLFIFRRQIYACIVLFPLRGSCGGKDSHRRNQHSGCWTCRPPLEIDHHSTYVLNIFPTTLALTMKITRLSCFEEDPTILSGTLRTTLDVFDEHDDAELVRVI